MAYFNIDELQVASPCSVPWVSMAGDDTARHCGECRKNVYNLTMLTRAEANELIREKEGNLCVKFYRRRDGTVLTSDCPVALRAVKRHYLKTRAKIVTATIAICGFLGLTISSRNAFAVQGAPAINPQTAMVHPITIRVIPTHHHVKHHKKHHKVKSAKKK